MSEVKCMCCAEVFSLYKHYPCGENAKVERDGKWYCGIHDPVAIEAKKAKRVAKWEEEYSKEQALRDKQDADLKEQKRRADMFDELVDMLYMIIINANGRPLQTGYHDIPVETINYAKELLKKAKGE